MFKLLRLESIKRLLLWHLLLLFASLAGFLWVQYRIHITGKGFYQFLNWNLFLAWIPFWAASLLKLLYEAGVGRKGGLLYMGAGLVWLLFLPNAPYIVTDYIHVTYVRGPGVWPWSDILMMMHYAWTGLLLGYLSLYLIHTTAAAAYGRWLGWLMAGASTVLSSVGVYVGRELRWNSWEVITDPSKLISDIGVFLTPEPYRFIAMVMVLCALGYGTIYALIARPVK